MKISLNAMAETPFGMFNITNTRADEILDHVATLCENGVENFESQYRIVGVVPNGQQQEAELMERLDVCKLLNEMVDFAETEDEKNYILYMAYKGINMLHMLLFGEPL